ncbi:MAG TPA: RluA family pseudouridine synthase [Rectinemataceae bacterium]|nr:RluA family pseudouridine synthase [Rectinemataceae bacterium]
MQRQFLEFITGADDADRRLDRLVRRFLPDATLPVIYRAIRTGAIRVDGKKAKPSTRIPASSKLQIEEELLREGRGTVEESPSIQPRREPGRTEVSILLETRNLLFVSKPRGMLSHGEGGLDAFMLARYPSSTSLSFVPAPLHRLDRNTTGIVACSRSLEGARLFSSLLRKGQISKRYIALLDGEFQGSGIWKDSIVRDGEERKSRRGDQDSPEGGRLAVTGYESIAAARGKTLALLALGTGRTHQIRIQAALHGHPLSGDQKYGGAPWSAGYILHAWVLGFAEPPFEDVPSAVVAPLSVETLDSLGRLFGAEVLRRFSDPL